MLQRQLSSKNDPASLPVSGFVDGSRAASILRRSEVDRIRIVSLVSLIFFIVA